MDSFGMICIRINNPRYYRSWHTVEEPLNPLLARIYQFHWCTMIQVIFNHWFDHHKGIHSKNYCHVWIQTTGLFPFWDILWNIHLFSSALSLFHLDIFVAKQNQRWQRILFKCKMYANLSLWTMICFLC